MNTSRNVRLVVRAVAAVGFILSMLYASAAPSDFTTRAPATSVTVTP